MSTHRIWRNKQGFIHRLDGPAIEIDGPDGRKEWWVNGKRHRADGPTIEIDGTKEWWFNGDRHRADGPAIEINGQNGRKEWWFNGKRHRADGPALEYNDAYDNTGRKEWWLNGYRHRIDGPALDYNNGVQYWFYEGLLHRLNGPAYHNSNKNCKFWIHGKNYTEERFNKITGICRKFGNKLKTRLRKKYEKELIETNMCDEVNLYKIIVGYMI